MIVSTSPKFMPYQVNVTADTHPISKTLYAFYVNGVEVDHDTYYAAINYNEKMRLHNVRKAAKLSRQ